MRQASGEHGAGRQAFGSPLRGTSPGLTVLPQWSVYLNFCMCLRAA